MKLKAFFALIFACAAVMMLSACGGAAPVECGVYNCAAAQGEGIAMNPAELYPAVARLELKPAGKGSIELGSESGAIKWSLDGTELSLDINGEEYFGSLENGAVTLELPGGTELCFLKDGAELPDGFLKAEEAAALSGGWYGWWRVSNASDDSEFIDAWYDCCGSVQALSGGRIRLVLWDEDGAADEPMAVVTMRLEGEAAVSESGVFWNMEVSQGDWTFDPAEGGFDSMAVIEGEYGDKFRYEIYLRPWGTDWGDVQATEPDMLPYYYESWYLPLIRSGADMPDRMDIGK